MDAFECTICLELYNTFFFERKPAVLRCGHTICVLCNWKLLQLQRQKDRKCPICYKLISSKKIRINYYAIEILEAWKKSPKSLQKQKKEIFSSRVTLYLLTEKQIPEIGFLQETRSITTLSTSLCGCGCGKTIGYVSHEIPIIPANYQKSVSVDGCISHWYSDEKIMNLFDLKKGRLCYFDETKNRVCYDSSKMHNVLLRRIFFVTETLPRDESDVLLFFKTRSCQSDVCGGQSNYLGYSYFSPETHLREVKEFIRKKENLENEIAITLYVESGGRKKNFEDFKDVRFGEIVTFQYDDKLRE
jgi:hypothetical protein